MPAPTKPYHHSHSQGQRHRQGQRPSKGQHQANGPRPRTFTQSLQDLRTAVIKRIAYKVKTGSQLTQPYDAVFTAERIESFVIDQNLVKVRVSDYSELIPLVEICVDDLIALDEQLRVTAPPV